MPAAQGPAVPAAQGPAVPAAQGPAVPAAQAPVVSTAVALPLLYLTRGQLQTVAAVQEFWWVWSRILVGLVQEFWWVWCKSSGGFGARIQRASFKLE